MTNKSIFIKFIGIMAFMLILTCQIIQCYEGCCSIEMVELIDLQENEEKEAEEKEGAELYYIALLEDLSNRNFISLFNSLSDRVQVSPSLEKFGPPPDFV